MALYEKFGEFDSAAEINHKAEQLFNAGDLDGLRNMACENGIPDDFVEMYISGENNSMCFLLNVHTGQMWRYMFKDGEWAFNKITMPWDN